MALVQNLGHVGHGRRAGNVRNQNDFLILPEFELDRITASLTKQERQEHDRLQRINVINESHAKSKATVSNWTNTIDGQRKAKLVAKAKREEEEEQARVQLDLEEELYQAAERKKIIIRAKKLQFDDNDRTKQFHAALGFVEILKEREIQMEDRKTRQDQTNAVNMKLYEKMKRENEAATKMEEQRAQNRRQNCKENQRGISFQVERKRNAVEEENQKWIEEGELLATYAEMEKEENAKKVEIRNLKKVEMKGDLEAQLNINKQIEEQLKKENDRDEKRREIYKNGKQKMMQKRQDKINELFKTQQAARGRMAARLAAEYKEAEDNMDQRIEAAQKEKEAAEEKRQAEKIQKHKSEVAQIAKHLELQLNVKEMANQKRQHSARADLAERKKADDIFKKRQKEKEEKKRKEEQELAQLYMKKVNDTAANERRQKELEIEFESQQLDNLKLEEDEFQQYATNIIDQAAKANRNVFPLKAVAAKGAGGGHGPINSRTGIRPSYLAADLFGAQMPTYKNEQTTEMKRNLEPGSARRGKKRLGFTW